MKDIILRIVEKLTSGKFLLTLIAGVTFAYATYAKILDSAAVGVIVTAVFLSYFKKSDDVAHKPITKE